MFINFWYAAAPAKDVTAAKPLKVRMLGQNFALFRDSQGVARVALGQRRLAAGDPDDENTLLAAIRPERIAIGTPAPGWVLPPAR